ncbi:adenylate kinase, partial [Thraustotheca clavata]
MDGVIIRRAQASDATDIASLSYPDKTLQRIVFGRGHVAALIETSYLALSAEDASGHVTAFLAVNDEPPSELAEDVDYFEYVAQNYTIEIKDGHAQHFSMHRSLFLSYFVQTAIDSTVLSDMLQTVHQLLAHIEWILFPIAKSVNLAEIQRILNIFRIATQLTSIQADDDTYSNFDLYASHMSNFIPTVAIRKANIEDHDDLEPILKAQNENLVDTFGEYFLAELIGSQTNHNTCLVAEDSDTRAVGLMALSDEIDLTVLRESFDLTMYNNLLKSGEPRLPGSTSTSRLEKLLKRRTSPKMILLGPPSCGKTTQVEKLIATYGLVHLSTTVLARSASRKSTPIASKIKRILDRQGDIPNDIIIDLIAERIHDSDCVTQGWILDGHPQSESQAWDLIKRGIRPDVVLTLAVPDEVIVARLEKAHSTPDIIDRTKSKLQLYHEQSNAILKCFSKEMALITIDGNSDRESVGSSVIHALSSSEKTKSYQSVKSRRKKSFGPPKFIICGPPAGGKGTQCELLVQEYGVIHLSTGDMLRSAIQAGSEMGLKAKGYMDAGELVPDDLIVHVILERLTESDCETHGWLLDGFPRTQCQAEAMISEGIIPDLVIVLDVPDEEVVKRISGRRVDLDTGKTYHLTYNPPPPELKDKVVQRSDDTEDVIRVRLSTFHANCDAVVSSFDASSIILTVDGMKPKDDIIQEIIKAFPKKKTAKVAKCAKSTGLGPPRLIICGPPAGGKGTQCELLVAQYGVVHLSTGDML